MSSPTFSGLGVADVLLKALDAKGISTPTAIQQQAIPVALSGKDIIGIAQTGTGKTLSFGLPLIQRLEEFGGRALVVVPTRELAYQVEESLQPYAAKFNIRTAVFVGGAPIHLQRKMLKRDPRILIATPGRLNDHLKQGTVTLKEVNVLVLDEADRMLDMGFKPQINQILKHTPKERQTLLFSATMPQSIFELAKSEMQLPLRIEVAPAGTASDNVEQELIVVKQIHKGRLLLSLLKELQGSMLVFSRTKHGAKKITKTLNENRIRAEEIHANRTLQQRRRALEDFKQGKCRVLVATDIAARGIDVTEIAYVINYDLPDDAADYVHRIGRTGRAGHSGHAISFATPTQTKDVHQIERLIKSTLKRNTNKAIPEERLDTGKSAKGGGRKGGGRGGQKRRPARRPQRHGR